MTAPDAGDLPHGAPCPCGILDCRCANSDDLETSRGIAAALGMRHARADELLRKLDLAVARRVPRRFLERHRVMPLYEEGDTIVAATCSARADLPDLSDAFEGRSVQHVLVTPTDFRRLRMAADLGQVAGGAVAGDVARGPGSTDVSAVGEDEDPALVALFNAILLDGVGERASDIHLERYGDRVRVRLRIDGRLHDAEHFQLSPQQLVGILNLIKVRADLDISERRLPQGGRFSITAHARSYDVRAQTQPALFGEHAVLRLLAQSAGPIPIEGLGFPPGPARAYHRLLDSPAGLMLVVGPTGSGKSTTLYAGLHVLASDARRKIITVEDPIEYAVPGVQQTHARPELGFSFSQAMRVFVRQDPDVILLGEVRDAETALEAIRASQTGHLVLTTLHCNDAVDAVQRLFDLGMHANSIAAELLAVFAQRLARRNCPACSAEAVPPQDLIEEVFPDGIPKGFHAMQGRGCPRCNGIGARGRIAVVEYLPTSPELRRSIARASPLDELRAVALRTGLVPMREHALQLSQSGVIAFTELRDLLPPERLAPERREGAAG